MNIVLYLGYICTGIVIGLLSGMFGFGGSSISTPMLRIIFNVPPLIALGSPLPMTLISSSVGVWKYGKEKLIEWKTTWKILITMIPGTVLGAFMTAVISGKILMFLTAAFLLYVSIRLLIKEEIEARRWPQYSFYIAGFLIGFLSGLLANGGGFLVVPVLLILGMNMKKAVGTSLAIVLLGVLPAVLIHWYLEHVDPLITLLLSLGVLPATYLGARIAIKTSSRNLQRYYGIFLALFSVYFLIFELSTV